MAQWPAVKELTVRQWGQVMRYPVVRPNHKKPPEFKAVVEASIITQNLTPKLTSDAFLVMWLL